MRERVLRRDSWRCQECGSIENLHVHHMKPRSELGGDEMDNLITLCANAGRQNASLHIGAFTTACVLRLIKLIRGTAR
jgi:5-methylcytosine-specific restriction endonuclease McrA